MPAPATARPGQRLLSLDVLRGLTIALMILVNTPGSWSHVYTPFLHSPWDGATLTDLVFPTFVFIVGVSIALALGRYGWAGEPTPDGSPRRVGPALSKVLRRTALIFGVGLLLHYFPFYDTTLGELRVYGVLQRIALAYGLAATLCLLVPPRHWLVTAAALLLGYWALLYFGGGAEPYSLAGNLKRAVDLATVGPAHMYTGFGIPFDPEGLIGSISTAATAVLGARAGLLVRDTPDRSLLVKRLLLYGLALIVVGLAWDLILPINKPLWTSSYACYTAGIAACALGVCVELLDVRERRGWARPFVQFGSNPLVIYALSGVLATSMLTFLSWHDAAGETVTLYGWLYGDVFARVIPWPELASLAFALLIVTVCWGVARALYRRGIFIKL